MHLSSYQKIVLTWGTLLLSGYLTSAYYWNDAGWLLAVWASVILCGWAVQFGLGWTHTQRVRALQFIWLGLTVIGLCLSYLQYTNNYQPPVSMLSGWFYLVSIGMVAMMLLRRRIRYVGLAAAYILMGFVVSQLSVYVALVVSGLAFFVLNMADAWLEKPLMKHYR